MLQWMKSKNPKGFVHAEGLFCFSSNGRYGFHPRRVGLGANSRIEMLSFHFVISQKGSSFHGFI